MKLTALEIKQQQFEKSLRGYDPGEVNSFLNLLASEWEHMTGRMRELENQVDKLNDKLKHYERVEEALHETLQTAKSSAEEKLSMARRQAKLIEDKAELEAEKIIKEAYEARREIRQNIHQLVDKRTEIIRTLRSFLDNASEYVHQFSKDDASLFTLPDLSEFESQQKKKKQQTDKEPKPESASLKSTVPGTEKIDDILDDID
ncbi:MAG: DivIVA domain-containing protein [Balneolaceae bacterium]|nr:MAG: DivIVA domain-containing protein [Balneolaceae bacterium]